MILVVVKALHRFVYAMAVTLLEICCTVAYHESVIHV